MVYFDMIKQHDHYATYMQCDASYSVKLYHAVQLDRYLGGYNHVDTW